MFLTGILPVSHIPDPSLEDARQMLHHRAINPGSFMACFETCLTKFLRLAVGFYDPYTSGSKIPGLPRLWLFVSFLFCFDYIFRF